MMNCLIWLEQLKVSSYGSVVARKLSVSRVGASVSLRFSGGNGACEMKRTTGRRGLATFHIIFLLVFFVTDVDSFSAQVASPGAVLSNPSRDISRSILEGLRSSPPTLTAKLDLETDFYDASTGLCSFSVPWGHGPAFSTG